jgi:hypothetical protein
MLSVNSISPPASFRRTWAIRALAARVLCCLLSACGDEAPARRQMHAIQDVRLIQLAEDKYHSATGSYAVLESLGPGKSGLLNGDLARGLVDGYAFAVETSDQGYRVTAWPPVHKGSLFYSLYSDESKTIRSRLGPSVATAESPRIDGDGTIN